MLRKIVLVIFCVSIVVGSAQLALADDFTSTDFINADPIVTVQGGYASSTSFQVFSGSGQTVIGESTSSAFTYRSGFFYFPVVTTPVVAATAGDSSVQLTWTSAVGALGFTVSGYQIGKSTSSNGPFTYTAVGNVLTSTPNSLTNNTWYYFVVRALDAFGNVIATSAVVSARPVAPVSPGPSPSPSPGGGGGDSPSVPTTAAIFTGRAYPNSTITLLKDAQIIATTKAGADANFSVSVSGLTGGTYIFSIYSEDTAGRRSSLLTFPISITAGATTNVGGIFIAPTIDVDKSEVKKGENVAIFGQSMPASDITISVHSEKEYFVKTAADKNGIYLYNFDTTPLEYGQHLTQSKAARDGEISSFSKAVAFAVTSQTVKKPTTPKCVNRADLNNDCKVNLVDYSIAAYWYKRTLSPAFAIVEKAQLNGDGKVNLVDFSIMAFYWTG